jgi:sugar lactone lactonase YvrE
MIGRIVPGVALCVLLGMAGCGGGDDADDATAEVQANACRPDRACVSTLAGGDEQADADGSRTSMLVLPDRVVVDAEGNVQVGDLGHAGVVHLVRPDGSMRTSDTAPLEFPYPPDVAVDARGTRYVADRYGNRILKITPDGKTTTLAGRGAGGDADGDAGTARFSVPMGVALGPDGHLYVADAGNAKVRKITLPRR